MLLNPKRESRDLYSKYMVKEKFDAQNERTCDFYILVISICNPIFKNMYNVPSTHTDRFYNWKISWGIIMLGILKFIGHLAWKEHDTMCITCIPFFNPFNNPMT